MLDGLRAICFDLDDTFWDVQSVLTRAELRVQAYLERHCPRIAAAHTRESLREQRAALARAEPLRAHDMTWLRTESMRRVALASGYPESIGRDAFEVFIAARNEVELFEDVLPALDALAARYVLATLSNGNADLARIGIASRFVLSLNSEQVGVAKPDARAFAAVASQLGIEPARIAYVGDDPWIDVAGAHGAGCRTVWINRHAREWPATERPPDLEVADLRELATRVL